MGRPRRGTWTLLGWFLAATLVGSVGIRELLQNELTLVNDSERHVHVPDSTWIDGTRIGFKGVFRNGESCWGAVESYDVNHGIRARFVIRGGGRAETREDMLAGWAVLAGFGMLGAWGGLLLLHRSSDPDRRRS